MKPHRTILLLSVGITCAVAAAGTSVAETRERRAEREREAGRTIELRVLEWLHYFPDRLTTNVSIQNMELLRESPIWGIPRARVEQVRRGSRSLVRSVVYCELVENDGESSCDATRPSAQLTRVDDARPMRLDGGVGFVFGSEWMAPIDMAGEGFTHVEFRNGKVMLVDGEVRFSEGLEATVYSDSSSKVFYSFVEGRWRLDGFATAVGGSSSLGE